MNRRQQIENDLRLASLKKVIYLEGKSGLDTFFALLSVTTPEDGIHQGVLVKALNEKKGSGSSAVIALVNVATKTPLQGVFGVVDGDGAAYEELAREFDPPHHGPLFRWKAYCIENLLAKTGWPSTWNISIDWSVELSRYAPYVALNRMQQELQSRLRILGLARLISPNPNEPLKTVPEVLAGLETVKHLLDGYDVAQRFRHEIDLFNATLRTNLDDAHVTLNGKWILEHLTPSMTGRTIDQCRFEWIAHAISVGGLAEVRDWWQRVTGSPP